MEMMLWLTLTKTRMKTITPKLSIITVCLNAINDIDAAISSVLGQNFQDLEYIVIDGGSKDGTVALLDKYQQQNKLIYISEPDKGIYDAMNKGINLASGEWIYFLGSDDVFLNNGVLHNVFSSDIGEAKILYGNVKYLHADIIYDGQFDYEKISIKNICHQAMFVKKVVFDLIGGFNIKYKMSADWEFNLRWMGRCVSSRYINQTIVVFNEKGLSGQVWDQVFHYDFENLLIENTILSRRSFMALKKKYQGIENSYRYKAGVFLVAPLSWIRNKIWFLKR